MSSTGVPSNVDTYSENPFRGPNPLGEGDPIFGRDRDIRVLRDQLLSDRLVLLHSLSGCGKSSLVEAGLRPLLSNTFRLFRTISVKRTQGELASRTSMFAQLASSIAPQLTTDNSSPDDDSTIVKKLVALLSPDSKERSGLFNFLFFDQFEESLTDKTMGEKERVAFFKALGLLLESRTTWAVFAIREDYLGDLQPYLRYLPTQLSSRFRLSQLSVDDAKAAIEMKEKTKGGQKKDGEAGQSRIAFTEDAAWSLARDLAKTEESALAGSIVEPVHLQVVCNYLWNNKSHPVALSDLGDLGSSLTSVTTALGIYYADVVESLAGGNEDTEFRIRNWFDNTLINKRDEQRFRVRVSSDSRDITANQLALLKSKYLIRDDQPAAPSTDRVVELAHDRLIVPVIESNGAWFGKFRQSWLETAGEYSKAPAAHLLLRAAELRDAIVWAQKNPGKMQPFHQSFLSASVEQEHHQKQLRLLTSELERLGNRKRGWTQISAIAIGLAAVLLFWALWITAKAERAHADATQAEAQAAQSKWEAQKAVNDSEKRLNDNISQSTLSLERAQASLAVINLEKLHANDQERRATAAAKRALGDAALARKEAQDESVEAEEVKNKALEHAREIIKDADMTSAQYGHKAKALEALSNAKERLSLDEAIVALEEARLAGALALVKGNDSQTLLERTALGTKNLLSRMLLDERLCIKGYLQSFTAVGDTARLLAIDQAGFYYNNNITMECPKSLPAAESQVAAYPSSSAIAEGGSVEALGRFNGDIALARNGAKFSKVSLRQQIVALTVSKTGQYVAASSALWSISVWKLGGARVTRILKWPGSAWNPESWIRWLSIFKGNGNQFTNTLGIHIDDERARSGRVGLLAAG